MRSHTDTNIDTDSTIWYPGRLKEPLHVVPEAYTHLHIIPLPILLFTQQLVRITDER